MNLNSILLIIAALMPAVVLCIYIFKKDRVEKEPIGLLITLLVLGIIICIPAAMIEFYLSDIIDNLLPGSDELTMGKTAYRIKLLLSNFIGVALVEEGLKFIVMFLKTRKNKNFNSLFDGVIYAVFVSLGFAAIENVLYAVQYGWTTTITRAFTSVPGHMFFAVMMGYYYTMWHMYDKARQSEREFKMLGAIPQNALEFSPNKFLVLSILVPVCMHGFFDYCCTYGSALSIITFIALIIVFYVYCFKKISKLSKGDMDDKTYAAVLVFRKHPDLFEKLAAVQAAQEQSTEYTYHN